ncbi:MAG: glycosyltransferase [Pseudomonadota bacterium]
MTSDFNGPVAYLTGEYPRVSHTFIQREAEALRATGIEVVTCSIRRTGDEHLTGPEEREAAATTFYVLDAAKNPATLARAHLKALVSAPGRWFSALRLAVSTRPPGAKALAYQIFYFLEAGVLAERLKSVGAQHIHNHFANSSCSVAMLTSVMSGIPFSVMMHGPAVFFEAEKWRLDEKIGRAAFVARISHFCRSQGMIWARPDEWEKMRIVHCGVDPALYDTADPARGETGKRLIFVGRLAAVKGAPVLLDAFARLHAKHPEATLTFVGDGEDRRWIEARIAALGLSEAITITGYQSQAEVAAYLARADVFVLPSFAEGLPVVLMEAMASRLPVVTTRIAGIPELVEDGVNGFIAPPGDADTLAARIDTLLSDPDLRRRMGEAGRAAVVAEHDIAHEAAWLAALIRRSANSADKEPLGLRPEARAR